jgi:hypothetical protein
MSKKPKAVEVIEHGEDDWRVLFHFEEGNVLGEGSFASREEATAWLRDALLQEKARMGIPDNVRYLS